MIDEALVRQLVATQFPQWKDLPLRPVIPNGWDNKTFRLGNEMLVRLPSGAEYADQVEKEQKWLPKLAPLLPLPIPSPLAMGQPAEGYPWKWSIYRWIDGDAITDAKTNSCDLATDLGRFLMALQSIDTTGGPLPGLHNFHRGGDLAVYDAETRQALSLLEGRIDVEAATEIWEAALATTWHGSPVWVHGDVNSGNLLLQQGQLSAVIDFGVMAIGDPACDLAIGWTLFEGESQRTFRAMLPLDPGTWARGRGWTLWKALIVAAGLTKANAITDPWRIIEEVIATDLSNNANN